MAIQVYPNSTPEGRSIPNEIINVSSSYRLLVTAAALGAPLAITPATGAICQFIANKPMLLCLGSSVAIPADVAYGAARADAIWLEPHIIYNIWVPSTDISAITIEGSAELLINVLNSWEVLGSQGQLDNG